MNAKLEKAAIAFGFLVLALLGWLAWEAARFFVSALKEADAEVTAAMVGGVATVLVGLGAALYTQSQIKAREADEAHRPKKIEIYSSFLQLIQRLQEASNTEVGGKPVPEKEVLNFMTAFKRDIILWSSPGVINAFMIFMAASEKGSDVLPTVDVLYREMRSDIGLSNRGLPPNQLIKVNLRNPEALDKKVKKGDL